MQPPPEVVHACTGPGSLIRLPECCCSGADVCATRSGRDGGCTGLGMNVCAAQEPCDISLATQGPPNVLLLTFGQKLNHAICANGC